MFLAIKHCLISVIWQDTADLSDLVNSGSDRKPEEVTFSEECELKVLAFRAERCFYLARSYSLAGKRTEAYALYCHARSLTEKALQELQSHSDSDQMMIKELKRLYNECRSKICIEHATGILEEGKAPENLSKKMSTISLNGADTKVSMCSNLPSFKKLNRTSFSHWFLPFVLTWVRLRLKSTDLLYFFFQNKEHVHILTLTIQFILIPHQMWNMVMPLDLLTHPLV
ncbi:hypothetical protein SLEP1_g57038 [Rubroshorea leprosula]|uniref:Uncharacterized protein n=1 Tax=Rubroshorea leprosula TaxID=152421 RepID=A0AAV5MKH7_9ROSI|nr:hypothetical protein SLEP1_g57038 [Rubroshorea leprosula]